MRARAVLSVDDHVLTNVGVEDDVAIGQSTSQLEMAEIACILSYAGPRSIVLLDDIGRETSTADSIDIASSVAKELSQRLKNKTPLTMFVTHFNELKHLATMHQNAEALQVFIQSSNSVSDGGVE